MKKGFAEREAKRARRALLKQEIAAAESRLSEARLKGDARKAAELRVQIAQMREEHHNLRQRRPGARGSRSGGGLGGWLGKL